MEERKEMYRLTMVEDNAQEGSLLRGFAERYAHEHKMTFEVTWFRSATEFLSQHTVSDLILMDIDLPGINGMEAAELLRTYDKEVPLIFVTNLAQYAVKGYQVDALDFMVKPVGYRAFCTRMDKALRIISRRLRDVSITVGSREGFLVIPASRLSFVEVANHDLIYHIEGDESARSRGTLRSLEQKLSGLPFVRISNSHIVNMQTIRTIKGSTLTVSTGDTLYFSRPRRREALQTIASYLGGSI